MLFNLPEHFYMYAISTAIMMLFSIIYPGKLVYADAGHNGLCANFNKATNGNSDAQIFAASGEGTVTKEITTPLTFPEAQNFLVIRRIKWKKIS
ncbi:hypothetical protein HMPREF1199_01419 [Hoylesella oralis CC98A]|nr:hypothetical protein HMPREF1199_01419 [Hoylesella oralis CC98A]